MTMGDNLARISFDTLRNTLLLAIMKEGTAGAVSFCKERASGLTGAYATEGIAISRTSLKYRNPENKPDEMSAGVLAAMQSLIDKSEKAVPVLRSDENGTVHYYKPILVQAMCLNCHGAVPGQIQQDVLARIDSLYPGDLARNYKEGELRGAWHIRFEKDRVQ